MLPAPHQASSTTDASIDGADGHGPSAAENLVRMLRRWFGSEFVIVNGETGDLLRPVEGLPRWDWGVIGEMCRAVAKRRTADFIEDDDPILVVAIPAIQADETTLVAVGAFLSRPARTEHDRSHVAALLGWDERQAEAWLRKQLPWTPQALRRMSDLAAEKIDGDTRLARLREEVDSLSMQISSTYEEISLLHRLTRNMAISDSSEHLAQMAVDWLTDVMPAQAVTICLKGTTAGEQVAPEPHTHPVFYGAGQPVADEDEFARLVSHVGVRTDGRPFVVNNAPDHDASWPLPQVRDAILVPLAEGENIYGWLAAFNRTDSDAFGTVEASLLNSVGTIIGAHFSNVELYREQAEILAGMVRALTSAIDAKDRYTCGHSERVARIAVRLGEELALGTEDLRTLYLSGLLHDIGKIGINDEVLRKDGQLTPEEYEHIKTHVEIGYNILIDVRRLGQLLPVVRHHHESFDGSGYPLGLAGEDIPRLARVAAVADAYDAMRSDRPYRPGLADEKIDDIFRAGAGKQWDPQVLDAFFRARDDVRAISSGTCQAPEPEMTSFF